MTLSILLALLAFSSSHSLHASLQAGPGNKQQEQSAEPEQLDRRLVLTFDDLPFQGPSATFRSADKYDLDSLQSLNRDIVNALKKAKVDAIGFVNEGKLEDKTGSISPSRAALLEIWLAAGFELGNHTYSHRSLNRIPVEQFEQDVLKGDEVTAALAKKHDQPPPRFLRHPFLHTGRTVKVKERIAQFLDSHNYRVAPVTIDNSEWIYAKAYARGLEKGSDIAARVANEYLDYMIEKTVFSERQSRELLGREIPQVLLLHDNRLNADAMGELLERYAARGYRVIDLDEALQDPAFDRPDGYFGPAGISWIERWAFAEGVPKSFFQGAPRVKQWVLDLAEIESE